jgi:iron complex outermembrane receptor protein
LAGRPEAGPHACEIDEPSLTVADSGEGEGAIVAILNLRARLLTGAAVGLVGSLTLGASSASAEAMLEEVVVTAQKRSQNLQEVPVSITALDQDTIKANRVVDVRDLNAIAPNLTVRSGVGGSQIPSYTIRGLYAQAAAAGTDKGVSLYLDGVYMANSLGSIFQIADIERIEVLKGPQGTLFGRNATGGAIGITTRDPKGEFGVEQTFTYGNYDQFVSKTRVDLPAMGVLSGAVTYLHSERHGDTRNLGAGTKWDFGPATRGRFGVLTSPKRFGDDKTDAVAAALKLQPSDALTISYKFDYTKSDHTPEAQGASALNLDVLGLGPLTPLFGALFATQPNPAILTPVTTERPKAVNNWFSFPGYTRIEGHNITANWEINDQLAVKNILSYRTLDSWGSMQLDGYGGLVNTVPTLAAFGLGAVGSPMLLFANASEQYERQWSDEVIVSWDTKWAHVTAGYIHFNNDLKKGTPGLGQSIGLGGTSGFVVRSAPAGVGVSTYKVTSDAFYAQPEFHLTDKLDLVLGYRITMDRKIEHHRSGGPASDSKYSKDRPAYLIGVNYKVNDDIFAYAKYSTAYISGGSVSGVAYQPELSESWEAGIKADLFGGRLRSNLAVFSVEYRKLQISATGRAINRPELASVVLNAGDSKAKGFEWENTAVPIEGLTLTANLGYTDNKLFNQNLALSPADQFRPQFRPAWTGNGSIQYEIRDMPGDSRLVLRADANYRSTQYTTGLLVNARIEDAIRVGPVWLVNARVALSDIEVANGRAEVALWARNLTNDKSITFGAPFPWFATGMYERARTYGVDVSFKY